MSDRKRGVKSDNSVDQSTLTTKGYASAVPLHRLRPMLKTEAELEDESMLNFQLPRKNCQQISPAMARLKLEKSTVQQHRWHVLKRILKRARVKKAEQTVVAYLQDLDRSDFVVPHGEMSKRLYYKLFHGRDFDLYGHLMGSPKMQLPRKHDEMRFLATKLGIEYTQPKKPEVVEVVELDEEEELLLRRSKVAMYRSEKWKIGNKDHYNAPVGFANNPGVTSNSLGLEQFYSYDGTWVEGRMEGIGQYLFEDGGVYDGEFERNRPHGRGISRYPLGQIYNGDWQNGQYYGSGKYTTLDGVEYNGGFVCGRRHGHGTLSFPSGLIYEGDFFDGKPHGRGRMTSKLTGWAYDGNFER
jgi:hypothetical protein